MVLPATDLQKSRDWYAERLGFTLEREREGVAGIKDSSGLIIFLRKALGSLAGETITLTIEVDNVESKFQELESAGVQFISSPRIQFWGYGAEVLDPDGYMNHLWDKVTMSKASRK